MGRFITTTYLEDLTDDEMMQRPCAGCNHIKWQLGHLIMSERGMMEFVSPGASPALPEGFAERYAKETASSDDAQQFDSKAALLAAFDAQRAATLAILEQQSADDLDKPGPEAFRAFAPTVASLFELQGSHYLMHAGQWAVVRRQLGRPPIF
ncbi:MAG: DinB family protein [Planctomycetales bacterium]|nr:DinB family protein [Planctomycetales bacterium]